MTIPAFAAAPGAVLPVGPTLASLPNAAALAATAPNAVAPNAVAPNATAPDAARATADGAQGAVDESRAGDATANPFAALLAGALAPAAPKPAAPRAAASPFDAAPETASSEGSEEGVAPESTHAAPHEGLHDVPHEAPHEASRRAATVTLRARIVTTDEPLNRMTAQADTPPLFTRRFPEGATPDGAVPTAPNDVATGARSDDARGLFAAAHARHAALVRSDAAPGWATARAADVASPASARATDASRDDQPEPAAGPAAQPATGPADRPVNPLLLATLLAAAAPASPSASATTVPSDSGATVTERPRGATEPRTDARADATRTAASRIAARAVAKSGTPDNDLSSLDPEFRSRLERVISRMSGEFGHSVEVVETYRDQGRQESLFAQGRTAPGPVVTWTRNSLHTLGRAADLRVDGREEEGAAYRDLRRVAEAEGLHTLGAKDPGHVEMPRTPGRSYAWTAPAETESSLVPGAVMTRIVATGGGATAPSAPTVFAKRGFHADDVAAQTVDSDAPAPVATVATVARVATVAPVAEVARVAVPGAVDAPRRRVPNEADRRRAAASPAEPTSASAPTAERTSAAAPTRDDASSVLASVRADAAQRVSRIMDLQDNAAPTTVSQMLLTVDDAAGGADRVRVDLRGRAVTAALSVAGTERAAALSEKAGELRAALAQQGLEPGAVTVTSHAPAVAAPERAPSSGSAAERQAQEHAQQQQSHDSHAGAPGALAQDTERAGRERASRHDARDESREQPRRDSTDPRQRARQAQKEKSAR